MIQRKITVIFSIISPNALRKREFVPLSLPKNHPFDHEVKSVEKIPLFFFNIQRLGAVIRSEAI